MRSRTRRGQRPKRDVAECGDLAERFIEQTMTKEGIERDQAILHSDRGSPMTCGGVSDLLSELGIGRSLSRPRVPNDNAFCYED